MLTMAVMPMVLAYLRAPSRTFQWLQPGRQGLHPADRRSLALVLRGRDGKWEQLLSAGSCRPLPVAPQAPSPRPQQPEATRAPVRTITTVRLLKWLRPPLPGREPGEVGSGNEAPEKPCLLKERQDQHGHTSFYYSWLYWASQVWHV